MRVIAGPTKPFVRQNRLPLLRIAFPICGKGLGTPSGGACGHGLCRQVAFSVNHLGAQGDVPETLADLNTSDRVAPVHVDMAPLQREAPVLGGIPAQRCAYDRLPATEHDAGVEISYAVAARKLPCTPAATDFKRMVWYRRAIGCGTGEGGPALAGEHPASFEIPAGKIELLAHGRIHFYADIFTLDQEVSPVRRELKAPGDGRFGRDKTGIDQRIEVDPLLRLVTEPDALRAPARLEVALVEVERRRAREPNVQVPVVATEGTGGKPQRSAGLFVVKEDGALRAVEGAGKIGRNEIVLGRCFEAG